MKMTLNFLGIEDTGFMGLDRETGKEKKIAMWVGKFMDIKTNEIFQFKIKDRELKLEYSDIKTFASCELEFGFENVNNKKIGKTETVIKLENFTEIIFK